MELALDRRKLTDLYTVGVFFAGSVAFVTSFFVADINEPAVLIAVVTLAALSEWLNVSLYYEGRVSVSFVALVLAAVYLGVAGTAIVASTIALTGGYFFADRSPRKLLFNFGQDNIAAFTVAGIAVMLAVPSQIDQLAFAAAFGAAAAAGLFVITTPAITVAMSLSGNRPFFSTYRDQFAWLFPHYVVLGVVGGGLASATLHLGVFGLLVLCLPLALSRYAIKQMVDRTRDNVLRLEKSNDELRVAVREVSEMSGKLSDAYDGTLESLVAALDMRDQETRGHSGRVATHSIEMADVLGLGDRDELEMIYRGALMHDVGKIGVPDAILRKPGPLTEEEWTFMRKHPAFGYRILAQVPYLRPAARIVLAHHERWDGDGYPRGLKGEDIPLGARIFAIADTYDAMVSDRPYRKGRSPDEALQEILRCAGTQFDPKVVEAFESLFPRWREEESGGRSPLYLPAWKDGEHETRRAAG